MADPNINPIYSKNPRNGFSGTITAANTSKDMSSGTVNLAFTAGAQGSFIKRITAKSLGTNVATVARFFLNNGGTTTTAANNAMFAELSLPAITNSETAGQPDLGIQVQDAIDAGYCIYVLLGTAVAAGWTFIVWAGDY